MAPTTEFASYFDDSFEQTPLNEPVADDDSEISHFRYNGPRDGHWEVASSLGSCIDDGNSTILGLFPRSDEGAQRESKPSIGDLLRRVGKATLDDHAPAVEVSQQQQTAERSVRSSPPEPKPKEPRPFVVPRVAEQKKRESTTNKGHSQERARSPVAPPAVVHPSPTARAASSLKAATPPIARSKPAAGGAQRIRILGKNGEEAFFELPFLPVASGRQASGKTTANERQKATEPTPSAKNETATPRSPTRHSDHDQVQQVKEHTEQPSKQKQKQKQQKQKKQSKKAQTAQVKESYMTAAKPGPVLEPATMSGGLPNPSAKGSVAAWSAAKDSAVMFDQTSDAGSRISNNVLAFAEKVTKSASGSRHSDLLHAFAAPSSSQKQHSSPQASVRVSQQGSQSRHGKATLVPSPGTRDAASQKGSQHRSSTHSRSKSEAKTHVPSQQSSHRPSEQRQKSVSQQGFQAGFEQVGVGRTYASQAFQHGGKKGPAPVEYKAPTVRSVGSGDSSVSVVHSFGNGSGFRVAEESKQTSVQNSNVSALRSRRSDNVASQRSGKPPSQTIFAPTGWISPHPLSPVPSMVPAAVGIPGEGSVAGERLSYQEFREMQQQQEIDAERERRNSAAGLGFGHPSNSHTYQPSHDLYVPASTPSNEYQKVGTAPQTASTLRGSQHSKYRAPSRSLSQHSQPLHSFDAASAWQDPQAQQSVVNNGSRGSRRSANSSTHVRQTSNFLPSQDDVFAPAASTSSGSQPQHFQETEHSLAHHSASMHSDLEQFFAQGSAHTAHPPLGTYGSQTQHFQETGHHTPHHPASVQSTPEDSFDNGPVWEGSRSHQQASAHSYHSSIHASARSQQPIRAPASSRGDDWDAHSQMNRSASHHSFGLGPEELDQYQRRLQRTVSTYSAHMENLQRSGDSHTSARSSQRTDVSPSQQHHFNGSHQSTVPYPPNPSYPVQQTQLQMPWDRQSSSRLSAERLPPLPSRGASDSYSRSASSSHTAQHQAGVDPASGALRGDGQGSDAVGEPTYSAVSFGTAHWARIQDAEVGEGEFRGHRRYYERRE